MDVLVEYVDSFELEGLGSSEEVVAENDAVDEADECAL
jgi:hypothetical protein